MDWNEQIYRLSRYNSNGIPLDFEMFLQTFCLFIDTKINVKRDEP